MASAFSHAIAALGIGACFYRRDVPKRVWALGALYGALPDADVAAFAFGIPYAHMLGHRGGHQERGPLDLDPLRLARLVRVPDPAPSGGRVMEE